MLNNSIDMVILMELLEACKYNNTELALELLDKVDIDINVKDIYGYTSLMYLCRNEMKSVALKLLEREDVDVNCENCQRYTALIFACENNMEQVAFKLLDRKDININAKNIFGYSALEVVHNKIKEVTTALKLLTIKYNNMNKIIDIQI